MPHDVTLSRGQGALLPHQAGSHSQKLLARQDVLEGPEALRKERKW